MKKALIITTLVWSTVLLASCGSQAPLTEAQQAEKYNMTQEEFQETKQAAARMNMTLEDHMKMTDEEMQEMENMEMSDDSHMIEDDMEMETSDEVKSHMDEYHEGEDVQDHSSDEHM